MKKGLRESGRSTPGLPALTDRLDSLVKDELSGSAMSDERENSVATVLAAIERVRSERSEVTLKYDSALAKLIAAGRDLGAEMPHEDRAPKAADPEPGAELTTDDRAAGAAQPEPGARSLGRRSSAGIGQAGTWSRSLARRSGAGIGQAGTWSRSLARRSGARGESRSDKQQLLRRFQRLLVVPLPRSSSPDGLVSRLSRPQ